MLIFFWNFEKFENQSVKKPWFFYALCIGKKAGKNKKIPERRHPTDARDPVRTNVSTCVADSKCLSRAERVPNSLRGKSSLSLGLGPARPRDDGSQAGIKEKEEI